MGQSALTQLLTNKGFATALDYLSPELRIRLTTELHSPDLTAQTKARRTLLRYGLRAAGWETPLGLWAAVSPIQPDIYTEFRLEDSFSAYLQPSASAASTQLVDIWLKLYRAESWDTLHAARNPTCWADSTTLRFTEPEYTPFTITKCTQRSLERHPGLERLLASLDSKKPLIDILREIQADTSLADSEAEARETLNELLTIGLLVVDNTIHLVGLDRANQLAARTPASLLKYGASPFVPTAQLASVVTGHDAKISNLDLWVKGTFKLGEQDRLSLEKSISLLSQFNCHPGDADLARWAERFNARFEGSAMPLTQAMDPQLGIPFKSGTAIPSLLKDIRLKTANNYFVSMNSATQWLISESRIRQATQDGPILITPEVCAQLANTSEGALAPASAWGTIHLGVLKKAQNYEFIWKGMATNDGTFMLGRFSQANAELSQHIKDHVAKRDADPSVLGLDLCYSRYPAMIQTTIRVDSGRPVLRLSGAESGANREILVTDLVVGVVDNKIKLWHAKTGQSICMHHASAQLTTDSKFNPLYQFLGAISASAHQPICYFPNLGLEFYPEIRCGTLIVRRAQWQATALTHHKIITAKNPVEVFQQWAYSKKMTPWIINETASSQIPLKWEIPEHAAILIEDLKSKNCVLQEDEGPNYAAGQGPHGYHRLGLTLMFEPANPKPDSTALAPIPPIRNLALDSLGLGENCLYVRLYAPLVSHSYILKELLVPWQTMLAQYPNCRWHFIRYSDDQGPHLRIRILGLDTRLQATLLPTLTADVEKIRKVGLIWQSEWGTYHREIVRYGGTLATMEACEELMSIDTNLTLPQLTKESDPIAPEIWAVQLLASWNKTRGVSATHLQNQHRQITANFRDELEYDSATLTEVSSLWRTHRAAAVTAFSNAQPIEAAKPHLAVLAALSPDIQDEVWASLTHMTMNRIFEVRPREQEAILHNWMQRLYARELALAANTSKPCYMRATPD